ncbi:hypothetical protein SEUCBS139899_002273 [Sporothrix eucalyptigena]
MPRAISELVERVGRRRGSPGPSVRDVLHNTDLEALEGGSTRTSESLVQQYFQGKVFPPSDAGKDPIELSVQLPILDHAIPRTPDGLGRKGISVPVPDLLYGYKFASFAAQPQNYLEDRGYGLQATTYQLYLPFLVVEFKGEGGVLRVATNKCLGGSACCVNIIERLNQLVHNCPSAPASLPTLDGAVFSIAMDGNLARLLVSWQREDGGYDTARVRDFAVQEPEQYIAFRAYVLNIIDWGRKQRWQQVCAALDILAEERLREAAAGLKARDPPSPPQRPDSITSGDSGGKRQRNAHPGLGTGSEYGRIGLAL